jgi:ABC-type sugar transport system ATPase subunit
VNGHLSLRGICHWYGNTPVLQNLDLDVFEGEYCVIVGPSGCGKSTLLRIIAGLQTPRAGEITLGGHSLRGVAPRKRDVAILFQDDRLYPHWTLRHNLDVAKANSRLDKTLTDANPELLRRLGIEEILDRRPDQISGGQLRRAALAKAVLRRPSVCLLDEPLSAIDAMLREELLAALIDFPRDRGDAMSRTAIIHVTHDGEEAMRLADRIVVMGEGRVLQSGTPEHVYREPQSIAVARAIGTPPANLIPMSWIQTVAAPCAEAIQKLISPCSETVTLVVRPEAIQLVSPTHRTDQSMGIDNNQWWIAGTVSSSRFVGGRYLVHFLTAATPSRTLTVSVDANVAKLEGGLDARVSLSEIKCVIC